jgi:retron-type reverse transcriptase
MAEMEASQRMATVQRQARKKVGLGTCQTAPPSRAYGYPQTGRKRKKRLAAASQDRQAALERKWNKVKRLHAFWPLVLRESARCTESHNKQGKGTPGAGKKTWKTPAQKMDAALNLTDKGYKALPPRRTCIEKKGKKEKRPLGCLP